MKRNEIRSKSKGFTLVELIIVIAVIGVLAAILIPTFANVIDKANAKSALADAKNITSKYVSDKLLDDTTGGANGMNEQFVIAVEKANKYYLFGYNTSGNGSIMSSNGNPFPYDDFNALVEGESWNSKNAGVALTAEVLAQFEDGSLNPDDAGYFYYVPTTPVAGSIEVKSIALKAGFDGKILNDKMDRTPDNCTVFHGLLLPGTATATDSSSSEGESGGSGGVTPPTPPTPTTYNVTFNHVSTTAADSDFDVAKVQGPASATSGSPFIAAAYSFSYGRAAGDRIWYTLDGLYIDDVKVTSQAISSDITVEVRWNKQTIKTYTLTFETPTGVTLNLASAVTENPMTLDEYTDITALVTGSTATKAHSTFTHWSVQGEGTTYAPDYAGTIQITKNMTLVPVFDDVLYSIKINPNGGEVNGKTSTFEYTQMAAGTINLLTLVDNGTITITAPTNKNFQKWSVIVDGTVVMDTLNGEWNVTADVTFKAHYVNQEFYVRYTDSVANVTVPEDTYTYDIGTNATFTISGVTAKNYYHITGYSAAGTAGTMFTVNPDNTIDTSAVKAGETIVITPAVASNVVTVNYADGGKSATNMPAPTSVNMILSSDDHVFTISSAVPTADGFTFKNWNCADDGFAGSYSPSDEITFNGSTAHGTVVTLTATWEQAVDTKVQVVASKYPTTVDGTITINGTATDNARFEPGTEVTVAVTGSTSEFGAWLVNGHEVSTNSTYTFTTEADTNVYVVASYKIAPESAPTVWDGTKASGFASGSGTSGDPYMITNGAELAHLGDLLGTTNSNGKSFKLANDIYLNLDVLNSVEAGDVSGLKAWTPIGKSSTAASAFCGMFDGDGHTVYGLYIPAGTAGTAIGLFGGTGNNTAYVKNLTVADAYIESNSTNNYIGGIVGAYFGGSSANAQNLTFNGKIVVGASAQAQGVGGVIGYHSNAACTFTNFRSFGDISCSGTYNGTGGVGGIVGSGAAVPKFVNCQNYANVTAGSYMGTGGIMGYSGGTTHTSCINYGKITYSGSAFGAGGIVGRSGGAETVTTCANRGDILITTGGFAGGMVGHSKGSSSYKVTVSYSYNAGNITSTATSTSNGIGGIVGRGSYVTITNSYTTGTISSAKGTKYGGMTGASSATGTSASNVTATTNCLYLEGSVNATTKLNGTSASKETIVSTFEALTTYFTADSGNINDGFPVLISTPAKVDAPEVPSFVATHRTDVVTLVFMNDNTFSSKIVAINGSSVSIPAALSGKTGWKLNGTVQSGNYNVNGDKTFMAY